MINNRAWSGWLWTSWLEGGLEDYLEGPCGVSYRCDVVLGDLQSSKGAETNARVVDSSTRQISYTMPSKDAHLDQNDEGSSKAIYRASIA